MILPGTLSYKKLQEFCIKQGVARSQTGRVLGSVPENWMIGARMGAGFGMVLTQEMGGPGGGFLKWFYCVGCGDFGARVLLGPGRENIFRKFF
jgi:hypothetical protein